MSADVDPRNVRAYELANACRVASLLVTGTDGGATGASMTRRELVEMWAHAHPMHALGRGTKSIRARLARTLAVMEGAGMVLRGSRGLVVVDDPMRLAMAAGNLRIVQDAHGNQIPRGQWRELPAVPDELLGHQAPLPADRAGG